MYAPDPAPGPLPAVPHASSDKVSELRHMTQQQAPPVAAAIADDRTQQQHSQHQQQQQQHDAEQAALQLSSALGVDYASAEHLVQQEPELIKVDQKHIKVICLLPSKGQHEVARTLLLSALVTTSAVLGGNKIGVPLSQ